MCACPYTTCNVQVVGIVGSSASQQDDTHSHQVAAATLAAVVPAWLQAGKPLPDLAAAVIAPLPNLLPHRRLPLLSALIAVVPQVRASCWCCLAAVLLVLVSCT